MFLKKVIERNKKLIDYAIFLHQNGDILPDTYVIDVDAVVENTKLLVSEASKNNVELYYMTKQFGRNPYLAQKIVENGISKAVVVDFKEALVLIEANLKLGNVGHLVQIPRNILESIILYGTDFITVYSFDILESINSICQKHNIVQKIMLRIAFDSNSLYEGQYGGFLKKDLYNLKKYEYLNICGLTSFPCIIYDGNSFVYTKNIEFLESAKSILSDLGFVIETINIPSASCVKTMSMIANIGTQGEPGHAFTGTTPMHADVSLDEIPAMIYVSEISHNYLDNSYCYGGGFYRRGNLKHALVSGKLTEIKDISLEAIDYHIPLKGEFQYGETVIMSFRTQVFVTRSQVALVEGLSTDDPKLIGIYDSLGRLI